MSGLATLLNMPDKETSGEWQKKNYYVGWAHCEKSKVATSPIFRV
jgi:hypothetical protein